MGGISALTGDTPESFHPVRVRQEGGGHKPGRGPSPEPDSAGTSISDPQPRRRRPRKPRSPRYRVTAPGDLLHRDLIPRPSPPLTSALPRGVRHTSPRRTPAPTPPHSRPSRPQTATESSQRQGPARRLAERRGPHHSARNGVPRHTEQPWNTAAFGVMASGDRGGWAAAPGEAQVQRNQHMDSPLPAGKRHPEGRPIRPWTESPLSCPGSPSPRPFSLTKPLLFCEDPSVCARTHACQVFTPILK